MGFDDELQDVPLVGGISLLAIAAYGYKKLKAKNNLSFINRQTHCKAKALKAFDGIYKIQQ